MQILTALQVEYCHLIINRLSKTLYVNGLSFQNKLFVRDRLFTHKDKQQAIRYCEEMYLANKGSKSYLLLEEAIGFTVLIEDESARIIGSKNPEDVMHELRRENPVATLQNIERGIVKHLFSIDSKASKKPFKGLETSLHRAISLGQKLMDEK